LQSFVEIIILFLVQTISHPMENLYPSHQMKNFMRMVLRNLLILKLYQCKISPAMFLRMFQEFQVTQINILNIRIYINKKWIKIRTTLIKNNQKQLLKTKYSTWWKMSLSWTIFISWTVTLFWLELMATQFTILFWLSGDIQTFDLLLKCLWF